MARWIGDNDSPCVSDDVKVTRVVVWRDGLGVHLRKDIVISAGRHHDVP
jgi:hypothetical protein